MSSPPQQPTPSSAYISGVGPLSQSQFITPDTTITVAISTFIILISTSLATASSDACCYRPSVPPTISTIVSSNLATSYNVSANTSGRSPPIHESPSSASSEDRILLTLHCESLCHRKVSSVHWSIALMKRMVYKKDNKLI